MAQIIVLDSGPLGIACRRRGEAEVDDLTTWWIRLRAKGAILAIPEMADFEVRRGLLLAGATRGIERLDRLRVELGPHNCIPVSREVLLKAAGLWADARRRGIGTADDKAFDGDVIVAAQALSFAGLRDVLTVATDNVGHLSRYVAAQRWQDISV
jgi:predicted nucleic acid-binding protein